MIAAVFIEPHERHEALEAYAVGEYELTIWLGDCALETLRFRSEPSTTELMKIGEWAVKKYGRPIVGREEGNRAHWHLQAEQGSSAQVNGPGADAVADVK